jgi:uncharacterized membrane protein
MECERPRVRGRVLSLRRVLISLGIGLVIGGAVAVLATPELFMLVAWIAAVSVALTWVWRTGWHRDHVGTEQLAEEEVRSRSTDGGVIVAAVASLGAVAFALVRTSNAHDVTAVSAAVLSVLAVLASWALVNTVFALKYARIYYVDEDGGIDFRQEEPPSYSDFAYMAFTVGMSFAVADCEPTSAAVRKVVLGHALLSHVLSAGILAVAINAVTNLGQPS